MSDYDALMKRCRAGTTNYDDANGLHADCYGAIGRQAEELENCQEVLRRVRAAAGLDQGDGVSLVQYVAELRAALLEIKDWLRREGWCPICYAKLDRCEEHGERNDCVFAKLGGDDG